jgi:probable HAF family extracellular repeat protein
VVVGWSTLDGYSNNHAFIYSGGVMTDLNNLISPSIGWVLNRADAINDSGQIVGTGYINGRSRAFLLTPVPEPGTMLLLVMIAGSLAVYTIGRWRTG